MDEQVDLFSDYIKDNSIKGRVKDPRTWVNLLILIVIIIMAVILIRSVQNSWTKEEVKKTIKIIDYDSSWVIKTSGFTGNDKSVLRKEISIVPSIRFRIKNIGKRNLEHVRFIGNFVYAEKRNVSIGDGYADILKNKVLKPGEVSEFIMIKSTYGYKTTSRKEEDFEDMFFKKKGWKRFNVRISARVKGTIKEIIELSVKDKFNKSFKTEKYNNYGEKIKKVNAMLINELNIIDYSSEWIHKIIKQKNLFIPTVAFKLKNITDKDKGKFYVSVIFEFDDNKGVINQWKGKKAKIIEGIGSGKFSEELYFEAEYGIEASSVKNLLQNKKEWEDVRVKIYMGDKKEKSIFFKNMRIKQSVKGYKVREQLVH